MKHKFIPPINMRNISSIQLKFVMVFVGILLIACVASMVVVSAFMQSALLKDIEERLSSTSKSISRLAEETNLPLEEIIGIVGNAYYDIHVYDAATMELPSGMDEEKLTTLKPGQIYFSTDKTQSQRLPLGVLKVRDSYLVMTSHTENNEILYFRNIAFMVLVICAGIGSILMLLAVTHITKPVKRLSRATKEVAKGNFDICVDYDAQDEIGQLTHNFNLMTNELKNMEYLRKDFVSNVSHEFKTPIASIQGFAQLLKTKDLTQEEFDEYTDVIISESIRLSKLSENLLKLSRLEKQVIPPQGAEFSLDEQIRKTLLLLEREWSAKELDLDIDLENVLYTGNE
ncbi:MAG: HAMP domain-containing sensor histidine kinase, partial [Christensenella sp.]|uniref:HAMP domain-containing sensor histidine kinase n=1 Tax=Christensenella sp. TaxID=1935934 RepID=UPI002B21F030